MMKKEIEINRLNNKAQLKLAIQKAWNNITIAQIRRCIDNLKSKMDTIVQCNGDLLLKIYIGKFFYCLI